MSKPRFGRLERLERLKQMLNNREQRIGTEVKIVIMLFRDIKRVFDDSIVKLIAELKEEIDILESVGDDMSKEKASLQVVENSFLETEKKLSDILDLADKGLITSISQVDFNVGFQAWNVIQKANTIKTDIDRWATREIREYDTVMEAVSRELERRGIS